MAIQDVIVTINVKNPAPRVGLGRPVIFTQSAEASTYREYTTLAALAADYADGTPTHEKAAVIFAQPNRPDTVAVATYTGTDIGAAMAAYYNRPWHFALVAGDDAAAQTAAAGFINDKDFKFLAIQVDDNAGREAVADRKRVLVFDHDVPGEHLDAAAVGNVASLPVGSVTWKFQDVRGVTPRNLTDTELSAIEDDNAIAYVYKAGRAQLSGGTLADGEYIDVLHGQDFVKADMENEVANTFVQAAQSGRKLPYDARGINALEAAATTALQRAFTNGIVGMTDEGLPDYTITATPRNATDPQDRADRIYRGLSFSFGLAGAIHEVRISGEILI